MKRIKFSFTTNYHHPLAGLIANTLVEAGYAYAQENEEPDFLITRGGSSDEALPTIILSSLDVYSCLSSERKVIEEPFSEHDALVIPSSHACLAQVQAIQNEGIARLAMPDNAVLRLGNVYGKGCPGLVNAWFGSKGEYLVPHSDQTKSTYMYIDDFKEAILRFVQVFIEEKVRGIYNLAHPESITTANLLALIHSTRYNNGKPTVRIIKVPYFVNMYTVADCTRFSAVTNFVPKVSIRKGIFLLVNDSNTSVRASEETT